jgi:hypothetical protein
MNNFLNKLLKGLAYLPTIILGAEHIFGPHTGQTKKQMVDDITNSVIDTVNAVANKDIIDEGQFNDGKSKIIDGILQCLNATKAFRELK